MAQTELSFEALVEAKVAELLRKEYGYTQAPLLLNTEEAAALLGGGHTARTVRELCYAKHLEYQRKEPGNPASRILIHRKQLLRFAERTVSGFSPPQHRRGSVTAGHE